MVPDELMRFPEARAIVLDSASPLPATLEPLDRLNGRYLAEPIVSKVDSPAFANSAVDGYGVRIEDVAGCTSGEPAALKLAGEVRAGQDPSGMALELGTAIRILTGAALPAGVEAIVMKEDCQIGGETVSIAHAPAEGENIRQKGEEYRAGDVLVEAGLRLTPPLCGLIAAAGHARASVIGMPKVAIVTTGDELVPPGERLGPGQIYESNSAGLAAAVRALGIDTVTVSRTGDDTEGTNATLARALLDSDVVLTSGGVSVGEYDVVKQTFESLGVEQRFWRVAIKPGMPVYFGVKGRGLVFGLPGNPVSAMVNFQLFVRPALRRMLGAPEQPLELIPAKLSSELWKRPGRAEFVRARLLDGGVVEPIGARGSHMLGGLAQADHLIVLPEESGRVLAGETVEVTPLVWA